MSFKGRLIAWCLVAYLIPIGIVIYERGYNQDALIWAAGVTGLAVIVELILYYQTRNK